MLALTKTENLRRTLLVQVCFGQCQFEIATSNTPICGTFTEGQLFQSLELALQTAGKAHNLTRLDPLTPPGQTMSFSAVYNKAVEQKADPATKKKRVDGDYIEIRDTLQHFAKGHLTEQQALASFHEHTGRTGVVISLNHAYALWSAGQNEYGEPAQHLAMRQEAGRGRFKVTEFKVQEA